MLFSFNRLEPLCPTSIFADVSNVLSLTGGHQWLFARNQKLWPLADNG